MAVAIDAANKCRMNMNRREFFGKLGLGIGAMLLVMNIKPSAEKNNQPCRCTDFVLDGSGIVGIGVSPSSRLHISQGSGYKMRCYT